jgi:poly-gamma-glutamate capsule biosynthesis protein CapA/YwtB (metallophosphatase superfamily)
VVTDETGRAAETASLTFAMTHLNGTGQVATESPGHFRISGINQPVSLLAEAPGFFPQPVVLGRDDAQQLLAVRLTARSGPEGQERIALHFGGDAMLGRRYLAPDREGTPVIVAGDGGVTARAVVRALSPLFRAADVRSLNLESVVGTLGTEEAYPGKRFLLQSPPETVSMLDELGVDVVNLGNNHVRDWLDAGISSTISLVAGSDFSFVGAGVSEEQSALPCVLDVAGHRVGFLSYTSVNGDFVNDSLPTDDEQVPPDLPAEDDWQYEYRTFGLTEDNFVVASASRRAGSAWIEVEKLLDSLDAEDQATLWAAVTGVYPELQDWVARRGHGGANPFASSRLLDDVGRLRAQACDLVVVQLHSGFQYAEAKSDFLESAAHQAIDAGADLVVGHHPHVLQGLEWYKGKLIAYSLGNLVFDQDFLVTFQSAVLRVVFQGSEIHSAHLLPIVLDDYRPVPTCGAATDGILQLVHERSALAVRSERIDGTVRNVLRPRSPEAVPARVVREGGWGRITEGPAPTEERTVEIDLDRITRLPGPGLTRSRGPEGTSLGNLLAGRDLLGWGTFEDLTADGWSGGETHWNAHASYESVRVVPSATSGIRCLRLYRSAGNLQNVITSPVARIPVPRHRLFTEENGVCQEADGDPLYTVHLQACVYGSATPFLRLDTYSVEDSDPTAAPQSERLDGRVFDLNVERDGKWHDCVLDLPPDLFEPTAGQAEVDALLVYAGLEPPEVAEAVLLVDDLEFIEWRRADDLPDGFYSFTAVRAETSGIQTVTLERTAD